MSKAIESAVFERRVTALFAPYSKPGSPGAVVGVMRGGEVEFCKGFGLASIELGVPIRPDTRFRIASVSKQFTVTAALMLVAEGKLKLSDPPHKYLPELPPLPVSIDQMMRNSSGLPDFLELLRLGGHGLDRPAPGPRTCSMPARATGTSTSPRAARFLYSNTNFLLLGLIVEKLTKKKLGDVLAERIFKPLGMAQTRLTAEIDAVIPGLATGYLGDREQGFRRAAHAYPQGGEGGLTSTVEDLLIWSRHFDKPVLGKTIPAQLTAIASLTGGKANNYRRGVAVEELRGLQTVGPWRPVARLPARNSCACRKPISPSWSSPISAASIRGGAPRTIAALALEGDRRMKPALPPITAGRNQAARRDLVQCRGALAVRPGLAQRRGGRDTERHALRAGSPRRRLAWGPNAARTNSP
jgi:CubicO group peptidase (beta-lactamase class C family)